MDDVGKEVRFRDDSYSNEGSLKYLRLTRAGLEAKLLSALELDHSCVAESDPESTPSSALNNFPTL